MYPFLQKHGNSSFVKLHKNLYKKELILRVKEENPGFVRAIISRGKYYLVDLDISKKSEYFFFLDYLIGLNQEI